MHLWSPVLVPLQHELNMIKCEVVLVIGYDMYTVKCALEYEFGFVLRYHAIVQVNL